MAVEIIGGSDIPAATESSVGSIKWPPTDASEQRKKGISHFVLETSNDAMRVMKEFMDLPFGIHREEQVPITRISGRIFIANSALKEEIDREHRTGDLTLIHQIEAIVPLAGTGVAELEDCSMVYLGKNDTARRSDPAQLEKELHIADAFFHEELNPDRHSYDDFEFNVLDKKEKVDPLIEKQYIALYAAFGWSADNVRALLGSKNNVMIAAFKGNELVSAGMAERAYIKVERKGQEIPLVMYEITEAATKEEYRGNGLYTQVAIQLMKTLARTDVHLIYAESNLLAPGVLRSAHRQGRYSAIDSALTFGLQPRALEQHVRISGGSNDTRPEHEKNDLLVTFMSRNDIISRYGNPNQIVG